MPTTPVIQRALISVSEKAGVVAFATLLHQCNISLLATGNTAKLIQKQGIPVTDVSDCTGFPEIMDGRVKTLHPKIHGALLHRGERDQTVMAEHSIEAIDLLVVNLYPFEATLKQHPDNPDAIIENIDIGGPTLLRAAAKNHRFVSVISDPNDYSRIGSIIQAQGGLDAEERSRLACKAFQHVATYDATIAAYFQKKVEQQEAGPPGRLDLHLHRHSLLRYGENPHQQAACYTTEPASGLMAAKQHQGRALSYNNLLDTDAAWALVNRFKTTACVIVKHAGPCGVACAETTEAAYLKALSGDPLSAFGGIIAFNAPVDEATAQRILKKQYAEVIIAPAFSEAALAVCAQKEKIRVLSLKPDESNDPAPRIRSIQGGLLYQDQDTLTHAREACTVVTETQPTEAQWRDALFANEVVRATQSNAIVLAHNQQSIGIGAGQASRVVSTRIAIEQAQHFGFETHHAVLSSDAFFPFADSIECAQQAGISCIIQPGGSIRDPEVIAAANAHGMVMILTHHRHFKH